MEVYHAQEVSSCNLQSNVVVQGEFFFFFLEEGVGGKARQRGPGLVT